MRSLYFTLLMLALMGCKYSDEVKEVKVDDRAVISIPDHMKKTDDLREDAILQYSNRFRNMYLIILKDGKDAGLRTYQGNAVKNILTYLDNPIITDSMIVQVQGRRAFHNSIYGKIEGELVYYEHLSIDAGGNFYQVCTWTRGPERKKNYGKELMDVMYSFTYN